MIQPHKSSCGENKYKAYGNLEGEAAPFDGVLLKADRVLGNANHTSPKPTSAALVLPLEGKVSTWNICNHCRHQLGELSLKLGEILHFSMEDGWRCFEFMIRVAVLGREAKSI